ncbi:hypothetical protein ACWDTG_09240 [Rhodococcus zopfii]
MTPGETSYDEVLEWVVTSIAEVITDKMGPIIDSEVDGATGYAVTLRTPDRTQPVVDDLPAPERHVWKAIVETLEGDLRRAHNCLDAVEHGSGPGEQDHALIEAIGWLDRLLDLPALNGPKLAAASLSSRGDTVLLELPESPGASRAISRRSTSGSPV